MKPLVQMLFASFLVLPGAAVAQNWSGGISAMGRAMSDVARMQMLQEMQRQNQLQQQENDLRLLEAARSPSRVTVTAPLVPAAQPRYAAEMSRLLAKYPNWARIVAAPGADGKIDAQSPFRIWLSKQPAGYQQIVNSTDNPAYVEAAINDFMMASGADKK